MDYGLSSELELMRKTFEARETEVCKTCRDRIGIPCLISARCEKRKGEKIDDR